MSFNAYQFPDGEIIEFGRHGNPWLEKTDRPGVYTDVVYRSTDGGQTHLAETVELSGMPELQEEDSERWGRHVMSYVDHAIVPVSDGEVLACAHGRVVGDRKGRSYKNLLGQGLSLPVLFCFNLITAILNHRVEIIIHLL